MMRHPSRDSMPTLTVGEGGGGGGICGKGVLHLIGCIQPLAGGCNGIVIANKEAGGEGRLMRLHHTFLGVNNHLQGGCNCIVITC